jgi:hypothetical protein
MGSSGRERFVEITAGRSIIQQGFATLRDRITVAKGGFWTGV